MSQAPQTEHTANALAAFIRDADAVLGELRPALAGIVEEVRPPVMRASELRRVLSLDQSLSWSVFNAATAPDARALASLLPGRRAMERFFSAAEVHGVARGAVERGRAAFERFEAWAAEHAGGREALAAVLAEAGQGEEGAAERGAAADLKRKRSVFRGMSLLWGRQARVFCACKILHPAATPGRLDGVFIKGMVGLRRTSAAAALHTTAHHWRTGNPGDPPVPSAPEWLDPRETGPESIGLLRDFCSHPLPRFRLCVSREGYRSHELLTGIGGPAAEVTYFTGESRRDDTAAPGPGGVPGAEVLLFKVVDVPIQVFVGDILIHASAWDRRPPEVKVYANPLDGSTEFRDADLLPLTERAECLGEGIDAARTPLVPRYSEMLSYAMERMGWKPTEFRVFRCRVDYPVMHTRIRMSMREG